MEDREKLLKQDGYLIGIATLGLVNGMHVSPWFEPAFVLLRPLLASFYITSPVLQFYFASLVLAVTAVLVAGVPAAIFERVTGRTESDGRSLAVWLIALFVVSLPALARLIGFR
ncbi:MAG: hypothetical protein LCH88_19485 [Proteobacteria bacterium]|nr:hypothetical protein [Pseudomonadota bacterium]